MDLIKRDDQAEESRRDVAAGPFVQRPRAVRVPGVDLDEPLPRIDEHDGFHAGAVPVVRHFDHAVVVLRGLAQHLDQPARVQECGRVGGRELGLAAALPNATLPKPC